MNYKRILVTGATGFIGSLLTRRLLENGYDVRVFIRKSSQPWRLKDFTDKIHVYTTDLKDTQAVHDAFDDYKPDVVFHLATYYTVEHKLAEIPSLIDTNVLGTVNLLEASKDNSVKLFVNTSSCFVYKEKSSSLSETDELSPVNLYAETKLQAEQLCTFYTQNYRLKAVTFRLFPPYGQADNERKLIPFIIRNYLEGKIPNLTTGLQKWDFVNVNDIVEAYLAVLGAQFTDKHEIFNIGTGNAVSIREVAAVIAKILNSKLEPNWGKVPQRKNEVWYTNADISKAKAFLNWEPKIPLQDGLAATIEYYQQLWKLTK